MYRTCSIALLFFGVTAQAYGHEDSHPQIFLTGYQDWDVISDGQLSRELDEAGCWAVPGIKPISEAPSDVVEGTLFVNILFRPVRVDEYYIQRIRKQKKSRFVTLNPRRHFVDSDGCQTSNKFKACFIKWSRTIDCESLRNLAEN